MQIFYSYRRILKYFYVKKNKWRESVDSRNATIQALNVVARHFETGLRDELFKRQPELCKRQFEYVYVNV